MSDEFKWFKAFLSLEAGDKQPLVELLRDETIPLPDDLRWNIAELFDPKLKLWNVRAEIRQTDAHDRSLEKSAADGAIADAVATRLREGQSQDDAFEAVGDEHGMSDRNVKQIWRKMKKRHPFFYLRLHPNEAVALFAAARDRGMSKKEALKHLDRESAKPVGRPKKQK